MDTITALPVKEGLNLNLKIDPGQVEDKVKEFVRNSVEESLNRLLDAEADTLCGASRYAHSPDRVDTRAGHYQRTFTTTAGTVKLQVPKLRRLTFESQVIERYRRREISVEEALVNMYLAGASIRQVEDITEALWGSRVDSSTISGLNQKIYEKIEAWRNEPITKKYPYVFMDGIWLKRSWGGEVKNIAVLVAIGVSEDGHRGILGVAEGMKEDKTSWLAFLRYLKQRGLESMRLAITDKCLGLTEALGEVYPQASWQRCVVHWYRNVAKEVPKNKVRTVMDMLKAIHAQEDVEAARKKGQTVVEKLESMKLTKAAEVVRSGLEETLIYMRFPREHWRKIRTNNPLERLNREIRRRTRVVGNFPDGRSALMLVCARLRHVSGTKWSTRRYMDMSLLLQTMPEQEVA